jgi:hypothetical protein
LSQFKLDYPGLHWKCVFDATQDRLTTFLDTTTRTLELFHRKLIVIKPEERLTLAIYVPQKIERQQEFQVDDRCRLFAFPHSKEKNSHRLALPTKLNYRLYCDEERFQLFDEKRNNSWVSIARGPANDKSYASVKEKGARTRARQATVDSGINFDYRVSIALDKFSRGLQKHIGRVYRNGLLDAVSNLFLKYSSFSCDIFGSEAVMQ